MQPKLIELRPNRDLLDPEFDGYKLSLTAMPVVNTQISKSVHRALPDADQYSVLHAKLFGLHNHIIAEVINGITYIYFIDELLHIQKTYLDEASNTFVDLIIVWGVPSEVCKQNGNYNVSLKFFTENLAVLSNGSGVVYILNTGQRNDNNYWSIVHVEEILSPFMIQDVLYDTTNKTLHLLLLIIMQEKERFVNVIKWVSIKADDNDTWHRTALRELRAKGNLYYCHFEPNGEALYIASEKGAKFHYDSENPIVETKEAEQPKEKKYKWSQNKEDLNIIFNLSQGTEKRDIKVEIKSAEIQVKVKDETLLSGALYQAVDADSTTWSIANCTLEMNLNKMEPGLMWPEVVEGDDNGEFVVDACLVEEAHRRLEHLCGDCEVRCCYNVNRPYFWCYFCKIVVIVY